jgi:alkylated DNA repair dioxygenase AlkB
LQFHDDGEKELGPTVAALSLGSPSIMKFRPKKKEAGFAGIVPKDSKGLYKTILEVPMKHGDMMVMHGSRIHGVFEVCSLSHSLTGTR